MYEQLDYDFSAAEAEPIKIESSYLMEQAANEAAQEAVAAEEAATAKAAPQQHFKKKMQQKARSAKQAAAQEIKLSSPETPPPQLLAIIANPDDLEDLSHLDEPILSAPRSMPLMAKQSDYIASYCSFLKNRTHK